MRLGPALVRVAVAASLTAASIAAHASRAPFIVSQEYQERLVAVNAREIPAATCRVAFAEVEDGRRDRTTLGNVAGRQVRSPPDTIVWIRSVLSGLGHRGIDVMFERAPPAGADVLVADARLLIAWVTNIQANKSANAAIRVRLRRGDEIVLERDYRGVETTINWASGDRELQKVIDTAFGRLLDAVAPDLLGICGTQGPLAALIGLAGFPPMLQPAGAASRSTEPAMESVLTARLDGWLIIDTDGSVLDLGIETGVPTALRESLDRTVRRWRFHPVVIDGEVRRAKSRMRITLAAQQEGEGYRIMVDNAIFPSPADTSVTGIVDNRSAIISRRKLLTPAYPPELLRAGVGGIVQLVIRVGRDGRTEEVLSRQTALHDVKGTDFVMRKAARLMEDSAVRAATGWTFNVQLRTETPDPSDLTVTVPVVYILDESERRSDQTASGAPPVLWRAEVRTARRSIPWLRRTEGARMAGASDLRGGEMFPVSDWVHFAENGVGDSLL